MVTKLKSVFRNPQSALALKALVFAAFFALAKLGGFSTLPILFFLAVSIFLYLRPFFRTLELAGTFFVLLLSAILFIRTFTDTIDFYFAVVYFPFLFYVLIGIKDLILIQRGGWRVFLSFALAYPSFLMFFYYDQGSLWWTLPLLFSVLLFLSKDFLKKRLAFWLTAFLSSQIAWAANFLPVGFVSASNISMLFYAVVISFCDQYLRGELNKRSALILINIFVLLLVLVLAFSRWGL